MKNIVALPLLALLTMNLFLHSSCYGQTYVKNGMVVSDNVVASKTGTNILKKGESPIDVAVATAFALPVTHPQAGNIGGGGFLVFMDSTGSSTTIDFKEKHPYVRAPACFYMNLVRSSTALTTLV